MGTKLRGCVKVEVAVLGSSSLADRTVYVDVKQLGTLHNVPFSRVQELSESRGGRTGLK